MKLGREGEFSYNFFYSSQLVSSIEQEKRNIASCKQNDFWWMKVGGTLWIWNVNGLHDFSRKIFFYMNTRGRWSIYQWCNGFFMFSMQILNKIYIVFSIHFRFLKVIFHFPCAPCVAFNLSHVHVNLTEERNWKGGCDSAMENFNYSKCW